MTFATSDLRMALERDEIFPAFQPVVELRTGQLTGFEVLARWSHPVFGNVPPLDFIPIAENNGLISALTQSILRKSFASEGLIASSLAISVNISPLQLLDYKLPELIAGIAASYQFPLQRLVLELTESALLDDPQSIIDITAELKALGCRLAMDDFGTGYSSLRHLHALPIDALKVDQSFVRTMTAERESRKIVAAVIGLGQSLGLVTAAEGVETREQAELLQRMGCDLGQGWLYGRPVPAANLAEVMTRNHFPVPGASRLSEEPISLEGPPVDRLAQLQAIYDGAPVGLCFLDRNLRYVSMNRRLTEMSSAPGDPRLGRTIQQVVPEVFSQIEPFLRRALSCEAIRDIEIRTAKVDAPGEFNTLLASLQPVRDEAGEVVGVSLAVVDITERKQAEQALRESEDHYRHTVELSPQVHWTAAPDGKVLDVGPRWEMMTGVSKSETLGEGWRQALHPEDLPRIDAAWRTALETGNPVDVEYRIGRGNGIWRWVRARGQTRRDAEGRVVRWYGTVEDIDDRKALEAALQENEARLLTILSTLPVGRES